MATKTDLGGESPGGNLARMLSGQRMFIENIYSIMRFLEADVTKRGWDLVRNGGYGITRNGMGRSLTSFSSADWVINQVGIAFVSAGKASLFQGASTTQIPPDGLELIVFQVRWLDRSPEEPVVWYARLHAEPEESGKTRKWEEYQSLVFNRLEPESRETRSGNIKAGRAVISGSAIVFTGDYCEVPVAEITNQEDVVSQLIEPALADR